MSHLLVQIFLSIIILFGSEGVISGAKADPLCQIPAPQAEMGNACEKIGKARGRPSIFDYYSFVFSWSPAFCADAIKRHDFQCRDHRFGFVVHGLWPENEKEPWPEYCGGMQQPLEASFVAQQMCRLPSARLVQCQWVRHGACTGLDARGYFAMIADLHKRIATPDLTSNRTISADKLVSAFVEKNPQFPLRRDSLLPICKKSQGRVFFKEMRICLDRNLAARPCERKPQNACPKDFAIP